MLKKHIKHPHLRFVQISHTRTGENGCHKYLPYLFLWQDVMPVLHLSLLISMQTSLEIPSVQFLWITLVDFSILSATWLRSPQRILTTSTETVFSTPVPWQKLRPHEKGTPQYGVPFYDYNRTVILKLKTCEW